MQIIFSGPFAIIGFILSYPENKVLPKVLGGVASVARFITGHEKDQLTESAIFISLVYSLLPKDLTFPNLFMCPFHNL